MTTDETRTTTHELHALYCACDLSDRRATRDLLNRIYQHARRTTVRRYDAMGWIVRDIDRRRVQLRRPRGPARLLDRVAELLLCELLAEPMSG
ncbi:MAG TPA: hypothetical protein VGJ87_05000 [Roseiflexaceae bacterium]|jgi:hypothetical protein